MHTLVALALLAATGVRAMDAIRIAPDVQGLDCMIADQTLRVVQVYVLLQSTSPLNVASFRVSHSAGFTGDLYGVVPNPSYLWIGDIEQGVDVGFMACLTGRNLLATLTYFLYGTSEDCSHIDIGEKSGGPYSTPVVVDCSFDVYAPTLWPLTVNWVSGCPACVNTTQQTTWGAVKALYR